MARRDVEADRARPGRLSRGRAMGRELLSGDGITTPPMSTYLVLVLVLVIAAILGHGFYTERAIRAVLAEVAGLGIVSLGQMLVMLVSGIDMSVSAVILLGSVAVVRGNGSAGAIWVGIGFAALVGATNALLVAWRHAPPFIATFGTLIFYGGIELVYTNGSSGGNVPQWMHTLGGKMVGVFPISIFVLIVAGLVLSVLLHTHRGGWIYAVGDSAEVARYSGVPVWAIRVACYLGCSLLAFLGGLVMAGYSGFVDQTLGSTTNLDSIAAVVIGGVAFSGGDGRVSGALSGAFVIVIADNIVAEAGLAIYWQLIVTGIILIVAVSLQGLGEKDVLGRLLDRFWRRDAADHQDGLAW